jgi:hypothetical protein
MNAAMTGLTCIAATDMVELANANTVAMTSVGVVSRGGIAEPKQPDA